MSLNKRAKYVSAHEGALCVGYTSDYVTKLARDGKISAQRNGKQWLIDLDSLKLFTLQVEAEKRARKEALREERLAERYQTLRKSHEEIFASRIESSGRFAFLQTTVIVLSLFTALHLIWFSFESNINASALAAGASSIGSQLSASVIDPLPHFFSNIASAISAGQAQESSVQFDTSTLADTDIPVLDNPNFNGVIIISETENSKRASAIRETFSDEIEVEFQNDGSGVITPVFREQEGDSYRFLLVPPTDDGSEKKN